MPGFFPMFVRLAGRIVVVVGGGDLAVRTIEALLACDAEVRVISPAPAPALKRLRHARSLTLITRRLQDGDLEDALLALAVDDDPGVNLQTARQGLEWNVLVSVADELALSDFVVPSFVHRGGLTLALHAGAPSTVVARRIGEDLEGALGPEYGDFIAALERARARIAREVADQHQQTSLFERIVRSDLLDVIRRDGPSAAEARIDSLIADAAAR
ncbi:MAG TPA: NAD(P)-dependent oxidoreductase [Methylomirabilota bacterium]|nr:NAD(P)-dependent oxidoreductase [Methylomirabilota bacterium]